jgi:hypothetical protein
VRAEEAVEIENVLAVDGEGRPRRGVGALAVRHDHVQPVHGAALKEDDQHFAASHGSVEREGRAEQGEAGGAEEEPAVHCF